MKINFSMDCANFEGVPQFYGEHILQSATIPKITFNTKYFYYDKGSNALKAIKFIAIALTATHDYQILVQECEKTEWKSAEFINTHRFFDSKENFFKNLKDSKSYICFEKISLGSLFAEYQYAAVVSLERALWVWNGNAVNPLSIGIRHFVISDNGAFACLDKADCYGNKLFINRADCIANGLDGLEIQDFSNKENNNMFSISDIKEIEKTKIKVIEIA